MKGRVIGLVGVIVKYFKSVFWLTVGFIFSLGKQLFALIFPLADRLFPLNDIIYFVRKRAPSLWNWLINLPPVKRAISRAVFKKFSRALPARPQQFTMGAAYTNWNTAVDRRYSGRHIRASERNPAELPAAEDIVKLCLRDGSQQDCTRSSLLFTSFAQWFTDSFLRTAQMFVYDGQGNVCIDPVSKMPKREPGRENFNTSNHEIDLCQIYGLNQAQTRILRGDVNTAADRGCLAFSVIKGEEYPPFLLQNPPANDPVPESLSIKPEFENLHSDERILRTIFRSAANNARGYETIFAVGLEHGNSTVGNSLMNIIFFRAHNTVARKIGQAHPDWDDDRVFETARNVMIVLLLKIVISDYIRHISPNNLPLEFQAGLAEQENWYRTNRISIEFNLLYRWHGMVPDEFSFMDKVGEFRHNNDWIIRNGVASVIETMTHERSGRITLGNTPRFLKGVEVDTIELMRAAKLASYNEYREHCGLKKIKKFADLSDSASVNSKLEELYGNVDSLEWYVGLLAEKHGIDSIMGDLMQQMVGHDAFTQALTNPLLSKSIFKEETFSTVGWKIVNEVSTLKDVLDLLVYPEKNVNCSFQYQGEADSLPLVERPPATAATLEVSQP